jgi:hypothetical protein
MADGSTLAPCEARSYAGKSLLFPVEPTAGETLLSYLVRCVERNHLQSPVQFLRQAEIDLSISGDLMGRLQRSLPVIEMLLGVPAHALAQLWGAEPLDELGRRRLGGVFLRPHLIDQARRRVRPGLTKLDGDQAIWMLRHFDFCPISWDILIGSCPNKFCGKPLTWPRADSLRECRHCREPLVSARPDKVAKRLRPNLRWLADLFDEKAEVRLAAMRRVPAALPVHCETDVYEFVLAIVRALQLMSDVGPDVEGAAVGHWALCEAVSFVLEYPKSRWDLHQRSPGERDKLYGVLARISRDTAVPVVRQALTEILSDCPPMLLKQDRRPPPGELTSRGAASVLGVPPGEVGRLVDAGFLTPLSTSGTRRKQYLFDASFVEDMRAELTAGMSARHAAQLLGLPLYAIPQLLALNVLQSQPSELSMFLRGDHRVRVEDLEAIADWISALPLVPPAREWVSLSEAFTAVGGRDKPWATVIKAALSQELPGGLAFTGSYYERGKLSMARLAAREFVAGGPSSRSPLAFCYEASGCVAPASMTPGEVMDYLNCSAVEISWLRERDLLTPQKWSSPARYDRTSVETFGRQWMSTREAAARLEVEPRGLWRLIETYPIEPGLGRGFYLRSDLESVVTALASEQGAQVGWNKAFYERNAPEARMNV